MARLAHDGLHNGATFAKRRVFATHSDHASFLQSKMHAAGVTCSDSTTHIRASFVFPETLSAGSVTHPSGSTRRHITIIRRVATVRCARRDQNLVSADLTC